MRDSAHMRGISMLILRACVCVCVTVKISYAEMRQKRAVCADIKLRFALLPCVQTFSGDSGFRSLLCAGMRSLRSITRVFVSFILVCAICSLR